MDFNEMKDFKFYLSLGLITILASVFTMLITQIIKVILKKKKVIYEGMEQSKKDIILSRIGRVVALFVYTGLYIGKEIYLKHTVVINESLVAGLLTGATGTLILAKGIYTFLHQWSEKKNVFERLEYAEKIVSQVSEKQETLSTDKVEVKEDKKNKWILSKKHQRRKNSDERDNYRK